MSVKLTIDKTLVLKQPVIKTKERHKIDESSIFSPNEIIESYRMVVISHELIDNQKLFISKR